MEDRITLKSHGINLINLSERLEAIEVIYDMRKGQNVMLDTLVDRLNEHTISHKRV